MFALDIKNKTKHNDNFRQVLHTGEHSQIVAMSLAVGEDIGFEVHETADQILFFVGGLGSVIINEELRLVEKNDVVFVPAGANHNVANAGDEPVKLFTVYAPPTHKDGTVHATKADAALEEAEV